jgi:hypothetical protein
VQSQTGSSLDFGFRATTLRAADAERLYDKFLLAVSMGFNVVTIWYAWNWN